MSSKDTDAGSVAREALPVNELSIAVERADQESRESGTAPCPTAGGGNEPVAQVPGARQAEPDLASTPVADALSASSELESASKDRAAAASADGAVVVGGAADAVDYGGAVDEDSSRKPSLRRLAAMVGRRAGQRPAPRVVAARCTVALLLVAAAASSVFFYLQDRDKDAVLAAQEQARLAACEYAPVLANYDAKNLDPYFAAVLDGATGDWHQQFESTSQELREVLAEGQVVSAVSDVQCAIKSGDETSAEAVVVIGQTITSLGTQGQPAPGQLSMVMRMEKSADRWLVNDMNAPLAPSPQP
jgi:Mce-associated membrane protein